MAGRKVGKQADTLAGSQADKQGRLLDVREQIRYNATEQFQIINQELGYIHISDGSQGN